MAVRQTLTGDAGAREVRDFAGGDAQGAAVSKFLRGSAAGQPPTPTAPLPTPGVTPPPTPEPTAGEPLNFEALTDDLLGQIQSSGFERSIRLQEMFLEQGGAINPDVLTAQENETLGKIKAGIARTVGRERDNAVAVLTQRGIGRSSNIEETFGRFGERALVGESQAEVAFRLAKSSAKSAERTQRFEMAAAIQDSLNSGQLDLARSLLGAHQAAANRGLTQQQLDLQRDMFTENSFLNREKFSEDQRKALKAEGFTDREIDLQEATMKFEVEMRQREFTASNDLANRNLDLKEKVQLGQLELSEIRNNHDMGIQERAQELREQIQLGQLGFQEREVTLAERTAEHRFGLDYEALGLEKEKFEAYAEQLEREYGLNVNRFELAKFIETGKLEAEIFNSQRAFDLQDEKQQNDFLLGQGALDLQRDLGFSELEVKFALGKAQISVQEEANAIQKWYNEQRITIDRRALEERIKAERSKRKGGLLGKLIGGVVRIGAAWISGGASEVLRAAGSAVIGESSGAGGLPSFIDAIPNP